MNTHRTRSRRAAAWTLALILSAPLPAAAQADDIPDLDEIERSAREALRQLEQELGPYLRRFGDAVRALDDYEAPCILPNGDILIPRKRPAPDPAPPPAPDLAPSPPGEADTIEL